MDNKLYKRYKTLKDKLNYSYKGYNLQKLVPGYLNYIFADENPSARDVFKQFYLSTQSSDFHKIFESEHDTVITYLINRSDYKELAEAAKNDYADVEVIDLSELPVTKFFVLNFFYLKHLIKAFRVVVFRSAGETLMTKLFLVALLTKLFNQIRFVEKYKTPQIKHYICFNSAYKDESLLTEYFNKRKIETISLQHGIFCDFKLFLPFDYINFDNFISQKLLCWGQSTIDYLTSKGIDHKRLILFGNPKYKDIRISENKINQSFTRCLVLLGRGIYTETNDRLLKLLNEYNEKQKDNKILFYLKKHPFLLDSDHKQFANVKNRMIFLGKEHSVQELLNSDLVDFTIAVNTTAYYESLALGKISLRWTEMENEEFYGMDDKFYDMESFETKLEIFKQAPKEDITQDITKVIGYVFNPQLL
ncbi:hypothetical protein D0T53_09565 [Dysgonomonas sp. 216]|uniref:hypothetical protein n=1 Tax=Dysgonomonas sp. 216 TaxID=2302934 RepID=UPI0013D8DC31|nr:hypothetical protein [Dysgonomonas sp. 216]NDW19158.1 hypothetical protein [Dysgonomonas sp. 216]